MTYYNMFADAKMEDFESLEDPVERPDQEFGDPWIFQHFKRLELSKPFLVRIDEPGPVLDIYMTAHNNWIVLPDIAPLLSRFAGDDELQFVPGIIEDGRRIKILNILADVDCLNLEKCKGVTYMDEKEIRTKEKHASIKPKPPFLKYIHEVVIDPAKAKDHHLFRIAGYELMTVVSDELKLALEECGAKGVMFLPLNSASR